MKKEIFNEEVAAQIAGALLGAQAVQLKSEAPYFVWASGWHSPIYCDNRSLIWRSASLLPTVCVV